MMISRAALLCALLSLVSAAYAQEAQVKKADGSYSTYKLLPVHFDPDHASVVKMRLQSAQTFAKLPKEHSLPKDVLPPVRDQGQRGTCVYFATVGQLETTLNKQSAENKSVKLSEQCLVGVRNWMHDDPSYTGDDKPTDYRPDPDGDYPQSVVKTVSNYGVPAAAKYATANCNYSNESKIELADYQETMASGGSNSYFKGQTFDNDDKPTAEKIKALLAQDIPVQVATLVYNEYFDTTNWFYSSSKDSDATLAGAHAIILVGYKTSGKHTIFTFRNSWGNWGAGGYGSIDDKLLAKTWSYDPTLDYVLTVHN